MISVVHIIDTAKGGGAEHVALDIIRHDLEITAFVLSRHGQHEAWKTLPKVIYGTDQAKYKGRILVAWRLFRYLAVTRPTVLHVHLGYSLGLVVIMKILSPWLYKTRIIYHEHGEILYNPQVRFFMWLTRFLISKYIAVSKTISEALQGIGIEKNKILLLANIMPAELLVPYQPIINHNQKIKVGVVGRLEAIKGGDVAITAFGLLPKGRYELHFFGVGKEEEVWRHLAEVEGVEVYFHGYVADRMSIYKAIDLLLIPSRYESSSLVLGEAMLIGLPVLANCLPALMELKDRYRELPVTYYSGTPSSLCSEISKVSLSTKIVEQYLLDAKRNRSEYFSILNRLYKELSLGR